MTQSVSDAVGQQATGPIALINESEGFLASVLPSHVDIRSFMGLAKAHLKKNAKLAAAAARNSQGYLLALSECASLGLAPGNTFHIVPFENRNGGTVDFVGITDYTGEIELIYRAGAVSSIKAEIVYGGDLPGFRFEPGMDKPVHKPDWFGNRGTMVGVYAYAAMKDGATSRVVVMNRDEVMKVKAASKTAGFDDSPWKLWEDRMWLKTAIHQLAKWVPSSTEYRASALRDVARADRIRGEVPMGRPATPATPTPEPPVDAEIVDAEAWPPVATPGGKA